MTDDRASIVAYLKRFAPEAGREAADRMRQQPVFANYPPEIGEVLAAMFAIGVPILFLDMAERIEREEDRGASG